MTKEGFGATPASVVIVAGGTTVELSIWPARSYLSRRAWTWRFHRRKLDEMSFVTLVILMLRRVGVAETVIVSLDVARD